MNYLMTRTDDMLNGDGLRIVVFLSSCSHFCTGCHNPETWDEEAGQPFTIETKQSIFRELGNDYISGITFSGGDPLHANNRIEVRALIEEIKNLFPNKTVWLYTGYTWEEIDSSRELMQTILQCDVLVEGKFQQKLADTNYPWGGSTNQRVIDVQASINKGEVILWNKENENQSIQ